MLRAFVFNQRSWDTRSSLRYFVPGYHSASPVRNVVNTTSTTTAEEDNHVAPIFEIINTIRQPAVPTSTRLPTDGFTHNDPAQ